jgi:protein-disulfide isomerase
MSARIPMRVQSAQRAQQGVGLRRGGGGTARPHAKFARLTWVLTSLFCAQLFGCRPPLTTAINDLLAGDGRVVIEFVDYECSFCRRTHERLAPLLERDPKVKVVLVHVPLRSHPFAESGARASVCAEAQGRVKLAHDALMQLAPLRFARESLPELAAQWGLDVPAFTVCLDAPATTQRLAQDRQLFVDQGYSGVPVTWVGRELFDGAPPLADLEAAFERL